MVVSRGPGGPAGGGRGIEIGRVWLLSAGAGAEQELEGVWRGREKLEQRDL